MNSVKVELSDVITSYMPSTGISKNNVKVLSAIQRCRTAALGGHIDNCDSCGHLRISYNSCRNRHCPKCQGLNKEMWIIAQEDMLLPVAYFHVVFTLPHELNELCMYNPKQMYDLLFKAAWHTLNTLTKDPKWIGAKSGATMILHTWSQTLSLHPHIHCIVPNGGLTPEGKWQFPKKGNSNFLYPVAAMKNIYRSYFMYHLKAMIASNKLQLPKGYFAAQGGYRKLRNTLYNKDWVVYTKKPFSQTKNVINYLGRYSHRVAITNSRIKGIKDGNVMFNYKDYRDNSAKKIMSISGTEFIRRFCMHILPPRYRKIRHFGIMSNASKNKSIKLARQALGIKHKALLTRAERKQIAIERMLGITHMDQCPSCKKGTMNVIAIISKTRPPPPSLVYLIRNQNNKNYNS